MSEPGYVETQSTSQRTRDYARRLREDGCPDCGHDSLVVTEAMVATRVDPACWSGRCTCAERNREMREGRAECPECGLTASDIHEIIDCYCGMAHESIETLENGCDCECHCGCEFET